MLEVKLLHGDAKPMERQYNSAGFDLFAFWPAEWSGDVAKFHLGFATEFDHDCVALIRDRSSLAAKGVWVVGGVIDADYRGEWAVLLRGDKRVIDGLKAGDRIAQVIFVRCMTPTPRVVGTLSETSRGSGGFGSTGS